MPVPLIPNNPGLGRLKGKVALVTGVARLRGMGNCIAKLFAKEGAKVAVTDIAHDVSERVKELEAGGRETMAFQIDLNQLDAVKKMADEIVDRWGRIDILCNVAGKSVPPRPPFLKMSVAYWDMVMDRNLRTMVNCCWAVLPAMVKQNYGKVVNIGSGTGTRVVYRYSAAYAASKGAVSALTRALALEMGEHHINVNTILPGDTDTADTPWKPEDGPRDLSTLSHQLRPPISRPGMAEEIAELALFLATDESKFITGEEINIDGGALLVEPFPSGPDGTTYG
jgi:NAD(P)-dependent dehydrogenase (short-subunit alcohol dehydrogenase family)